MFSWKFWKFGPLGLALACALGVCQAAAGQTRPLIIRHVATVDVGSGKITPGQSVVIRGDRIAEIGAAGRVGVPAGAQVVEGEGQYLIPGLWDMHVHFWTPQPLFGLYLKHGVTGVRDMGSRLARTAAWRKEVSSGRLPGPRMTTAGPAVDGRPAELPEMPVLKAATPDEARKAVDQLERLDVDFIKVLSGLSRDTYLSLALQARHLRIPFAGHLPDAVRAQDAVNARQRSIEHLFGLLLACSREETALRPKRLEALAGKAWPKVFEIDARVRETYDEAKAAELFRLFDIYKTYVTPTLTMHRRTAQLGLDELTREGELAFVPTAVRKGWKDPREEGRNWPQAVQVALRTDYERQVQLVSAMQKAGVKLLAGTDTGDPYVVPGASLHDELALLVSAGLTPLAALQTATRNAVEFLGVADQLGSVDRGKYADLVLLDADPLENIRNTRRVAGVVVAGRYFSRKQLQGLAGGS